MREIFGLISERAFNLYILATIGGSCGAMQVSPAGCSNMSVRGVP